MTVIRYHEMESPIGILTLGCSEKGLCQIEFGAYGDQEHRLLGWSRRYFGTEAWRREPGALAAVEDQLQRYFAGELRTFDLELDLRGTPFQLQVWQALTGIPYGAAHSYKRVAEAIGSPKAVRAVGGANNRNPVPVVVPCHRVIGAAGAMVGYGGGLDIKTFLLGLEGFAPEAGGELI
ncbi:MULTISPECIES: methylated-DNA--[protein]-cysteine S-methyltransferase [Paenibacillus]|uniref:methylated-DNA--[protein]-cysteine S-methyltransferase n=1 Tax=Paenibacillus TaxID=44249 RepID=UPI0022B85CB7|nr:methylated-DNA--[protein]-cysteine S-methyltransferase [Paenibacillus caseinilyticus]MCZ8523865.1 methylated-DNA--[protein]-cysteine S-methyltransferase [Paenibacillus caseinilyticus]